MTLWLGLLLGSVLGLFAAIDGWVFDRLVQISPRPQLDSHVAVVRYETTALAELGKQQAALRSAGARGILLVLPASAGDGSYRGPGKGEWQLDQRGSGCHPAAAGGVVRSLPSSDFDGQPCLIAQLRRHLIGKGPNLGVLVPDFSIRSSTALPVLDSAKGIGVAGLSPAVSGRVVLMYPQPDPAIHVTPQYGDDGLMPTSVLYALVLDAAMRDRSVQWIRSPGDWLLAMVVIFFLHWQARRVSYRGLLAACALAPIPVLAACWGLLRFGQVYLPLTATLLAIGGFSLQLLIQRNTALAATLMDLDHQLTGLVQRPLGSPFIRGSDDVWNEVNHFIAQFFELSRSMMMSVAPGDHVLVPTASIGCTADDIVEKRRDFRRTPYLAAIAQGRPLRLDKPFFRALDSGTDFLAPLVVAEQLIGFWAFTLPGGDAAAMDAVAQDAARYADEMAKVLLQSTENAGDPQRAGRARHFTSLARTRSRLFAVALLARQQLDAYRDVFSSMGHPIAVSDLFGRIQFSNRRFEQFAATTGRPLLAMSVHNLLEQLCQLSPSATKETLRGAVARQRLADEGIPLAISGLPAPYSLFLRPVLRHAAQGQAPIANSPFDVIGLAIELIPAAVPAADPDSASDSDQPPGADIAGMLALIRHQVLPLAVEKTVDVLLMPGPPVPAVLAGAPLATMLSELFLLLIDDAIPRSEVRVRVRHDQGEGEVVVEMSNAGFGMPDWHVAEAMQQRSQGPGSAASATPLARVAAAAQRLDANVSVRVTSEIGRGFTAELRCAEFVKAS